MEMENGQIYDAFGQMESALKRRFALQYDESVDLAALTVSGFYRV